MKADTMPTKTPTRLRVVLDITSLGEIPEHQHTTRLAKKIEAYFNDDICDEPLSAQLRHFGDDTAARMLRHELTSWLEFLKTKPNVVSITPLP